MLRSYKRVHSYSHMRNTLSLTPTYRTTLKYRACQLSRIYVPPGLICFSRYSILMKWTQYILFKWRHPARAAKAQPFTQSRKSFQLRQKVNHGIKRIPCDGMTCPAPFISTRTAREPKWLRTIGWPVQSNDSPLFDFHATSYRFHETMMTTR